MTKCGPCSETLFLRQSVTASHTIRLGSRRVSPGSRPLLASSSRGGSMFSRRCGSKAQRNWRSCANNSKQNSSASCRERTGPTWIQPLKMPTLSKPPRTNAGLNHPRQMLKSCLIPTRCTARTRALRNVMGKAQTPRKRNLLHLHYRPDVAGEVTLSRFNASLARATAIPNAHVLTGGDLNFPSWDWKLMTLKPKPACPRLHHEFITMLND